MTANVILGGAFGPARWPTTSSRWLEPYGGSMAISAAFVNGRRLTISNGLAWSQDRGTLYLIDSPTLNVLAFPLTSAGEIAGEPSICVQIPEDWDAVPDGMCIDAEGMLWIALFGGGCVTRWDPISGQLLERLALPCRQVTSCCFGGPNLDQLFITTARREMDAAAIKAEPLAGGLFQADVGVKGLPADCFQVAA